MLSDILSGRTSYSVSYVFTFERDYDLSVYHRQKEASKEYVESI
jgi:hypothetical protein